MSKTITTLYFTRHGETDYNRAGIVQGRGVDKPLNTVGLAQAEALKDRLSNVWLDAIYASPLQRAAETAECVGRTHPHLKIRKMKDLEEISWGVWEGQNFTPEGKALFGQLRSAWMAGNFEAKLEGGESAMDVQRRGVRAVQNILQQHEGETILIVTHGRFLRIVLASLLPEFGLKRMEQVKHTNTSLNVLSFDGERFKAALLNDTSHLRGLDFLQFD